MFDGSEGVFSNSTQFGEDSTSDVASFGRLYKSYPESRTGLEKDPGACGTTDAISPGQAEQAE